MIEDLRNDLVAQLEDQDFIDLLLRGLLSERGDPIFRFVGFLSLLGLLSGPGFLGGWTRVAEQKGALREESRVFLDEGLEAVAVLARGR